MTAPHIERMQIELAELSERTSKLVAFLHGPVFKRLPADERELMVDQLGHMEAYRDTLETRLDLALRST